MENTKAKKIIIGVLLILLLACLGVIVWQYIRLNTQIENNNNLATEKENTESSNTDVTDVEEVVDNTKKEETEERQNNETQKEDDVKNGTENKQEEKNDEVTYPNTMGAIFEYDIEDLNQSVNNKKKNQTYIKIRNSNNYTISKDRKSIIIGDKTLKFDKEIYHACVFPLGQGSCDLWVILLRDGTVKYTKDYGETIINGGEHIIDVFPVEYEINTERKTYGSTIIVVNEYGALIDLGNSQVNED